MNLTSLNDTTDTLLAIGGVVTVFAGWWRWVRPRWKRFWRKLVAALDSIVGRDAIVDSITGEEKVPALPGIGVRMAHQERLTAENTKSMIELTETVATLAKVVEHQSRLDVLVEDHEKRLTALEAARVEQMIARKESTAAYEAIAAAHKGAADTILDEPLANDEIEERP